MDPAGHWFRARFESLPNLALINEYRKLTGPSIPMFVVHVGAGSGLQTDLFLPPDATRLVQTINATSHLPPFTPCDRPGDAGIKLLFGDESDMAKYFPLRGSH